MAHETRDARLLSVNESETSPSPMPADSSSLNNRSREANSNRLSIERRRSWIVFPSNPYSSSDLILQQQQQQTSNLLRLRRSRLGQSEPNLRYSSSAAMKPTTVTSSTLVPTSPRLSNARRPNLSGFNLINLKNALRKQSANLGESTVDSHSLDDETNRRWSLTSVPSSSGYGTTSPTASPYASIERLQHQQQSICTCKQQQQWETSPHDDLQRVESLSISMSLLDANLSPSSGKMLFFADQDHRHSLTYVYKERYPKAKVQMEERLEAFLETYKSVEKYECCSDGSARFIHHQLIQLATDCLEKSVNDQMTTFYFNEMTENLERLIINTNEKCPQAMKHVEVLVKKLLFIIARSARLLECLQFDPEDFLRTLDEVEYQAKSLIQIKQDIPKYICSKLNLERNPCDAIDDILRVSAGVMNLIREIARPFL